MSTAGQADEALVGAQVRGRRAGQTTLTRPSSGNFGVEIPTAVEGVPSEILNLRNCRDDKAAIDATSFKLAHTFKDNFTQFILADKDLFVHGPRA